jgi:hypothetical protein
MKLSTLSKLSLIAIAIAPLMIACSSTAEKAKTVTVQPETKAKTQEDGWETFTSTEGGFSIDMPGKPAPTEQKIPLPDGQTAVQKLVAIEKSKIAYIVSYVDYPTDLMNGLTPQDVLKSAIEGSVESLEGEASLQQTETIVDGFPCRSFNTRGKVNGKDAQAEGIACLGNARLYNILVLGEQRDNFSETVKPFISSLKLTKS